MGLQEASPKCLRWVRAICFLRAVPRSCASTNPIQMLLPQVKSSLTFSLKHYKMLVIGQPQQLTMEKQLSKECLQWSLQSPLTILVKEVVTIGYWRKTVSFQLQYRSEEKIWSASPAMTQKLNWEKKTPKYFNLFFLSERIHFKSLHPTLKAMKRKIHFTLLPLRKWLIGSAKGGSTSPGEICLLC